MHTYIHISVRVYHESLIGSTCKSSFSFLAESVFMSGRWMPEIVFTGLRSLDFTFMFSYIEKNAPLEAIWTYKSCLLVVLTL